MPVADLRVIKNSRNGLPARYASILWLVNVRDKKMTGISELRNEVAINCKRVRRSPVCERSLCSYLNWSRLLAEAPELAYACGAASTSEPLIEYAKYGMAGPTHFAFIGSPDTIRFPERTTAL